MTEDEDIPPEVPTTQAELDLAIMLLGHLGQHGSLRPSKRSQLVKLVGAYPSQPQAVAWKAVMKGLRPEMRELDGAEKRRRVVPEPRNAREDGWGEG